MSSRLMAHLDKCLPGQMVPRQMSTRTNVGASMEHAKALSVKPPMLYTVAAKVTQLKCTCMTLSI